MSLVPAGHAWKPHQGRAQRLRHLRSLCAAILASKDPATVGAVEKVRLATSGEAEPEYGMLFLINKAREIADDNGAPWPEIMELVMGMLTKAAEETTA